MTTSAAGDEGIDGIIMQDKLGFDLIYVQVKRWERGHVVGPGLTFRPLWGHRGEGRKGVVCDHLFLQQAGSGVC